MDSDVKVNALMVVDDVARLLQLYLAYRQWNPIYPEMWLI